MGNAAVHPAGDFTASGRDSRRRRRSYERSGASAGPAAFATGRLGSVAVMFGGADVAAKLRATTDNTGLATAAASLFEQLGTPLPAAQVLTGVNLPAFQNSVAARIDPAAAIDAETHLRTVRTDSRVGAAPFIVAPSFPQAASGWLIRKSSDWLLPGLTQVPEKTVALLAVDQRFVEAFMAGLNHEMGTWLNFDEYPTDVSATYFKSFWSDGVDDVAAIADWSTLGNNPAPGAFGGGRFVLLIRGPLVQRYPNMQVLAVPATAAGPQRTLGATETWPIFSGRVDPDIAFFGFPLTSAQHSVPRRRRDTISSFRNIPPSRISVAQFRRGVRPRSLPPFCSIL